MQTIVNPQQTRLFDPFDNVLTEKNTQTPARRLVWQFFGMSFLELMPVDTHQRVVFIPAMGRPTKELYSMAGLVLDPWNSRTGPSKTRPLDAYQFSYWTFNTHLNLEPVAQ